MDNKSKINTKESRPATENPILTFSVCNFAILKTENAYAEDKASLLDTSVKTYLKYRRYKCPECPYFFIKPRTLKVHLRGHTEGKYKCQYCSFKASLASRLKAHLIKHSGEKPYRCQHCPYAGSGPHLLKSHQRKHSGEKPYKCQHCLYASSQAANLERHMRTHSGEKP